MPVSPSHTFTSPDLWPLPPAEASKVPWRSKASLLHVADVPQFDGAIAAASRQEATRRAERHTVDMSGVTVAVDASTPRRGNRPCPQTQRRTQKTDSTHPSESWHLTKSRDETAGLGIPELHRAIVACGR